MKRYRVTSKFRDKSGRTLRTADTFDGAEEDARCALVEAHKEMTRVCAADPRIDSIISTVKGPEGEISTTDYADELGTVSSTGLMHEVAPEDLEPARGGLVKESRDAGTKTINDIFAGGEGFVSNVVFPDFKLTPEQQEVRRRIESYCRNNQQEKE